MTFLDALAKEKRWYRRVIIITLFHNKMLLKQRKWTMRATAKKLQISLGQVSESIRLAKAIMDNPELESLTRNEALQVIK